MSGYKKRMNFNDTDEGVATLAALKSMVADAKYHTEPSYSANTKLYPDHLIPFTDKHMDYLRDHPATDPNHYLANLKLMTKLRVSTK